MCRTTPTPPSRETVGAENDIPCRFRGSINTTRFDSNEPVEDQFGVSRQRLCEFDGDGFPKKPYARGWFSFFYVPSFAIDSFLVGGPSSVENWVFDHLLDRGLAVRFASSHVASRFKFARRWAEVQNQKIKKPKMNEVC